MGKSQKFDTKYLSRRLISSDGHEFVGRIFDLSIVELNFEKYDDLAAYPDCKYVFHINTSMSHLTRRVESINLVGDLIWLNPHPKDDIKLPVSKYDWLNVALDVFLMRLISVFDCVLLLVNDVYELGLTDKQCTFRAVSRNELPTMLIGALTAMIEDHDLLRRERNSRVHHGYERAHSSCDASFRTAAMFEHRNQPLNGKDSLGKKISVDRYLREGLVQLQHDYNAAIMVLENRLDEIYGLLLPEFERRFGQKFNDPDNGFGFKTKITAK